MINNIRELLVKQIDGLKRKVEEDSNPYGDWYKHYMHTQELLVNFDGQKPLEWNDYTYLLYLQNAEWKKAYEWVTIPSDHYMDELSNLTARGLELLMHHGVRKNDIFSMKKNERAKMLEVMTGDLATFSLPIK